jgi:uncharacterized protein YcnI
LKRVLLLAAVLVGLPATPAFAHVTVSSTNATPGGYATVVVKVPTESATASTVGLTVQLPAATPFASVGVQPVPGWSIATKTSKLPKPITNDDGDKVTTYISQITWTARPAQGIKPGQFQQFPISLGALPSSPGDIAFPAIQRYSDGSVVRWNETAAAGASEPEHPTPTLTVSAPKAAPKAESTTAAKTLSIIALALAAAALGLGVVNRARQS